MRMRSIGSICTATVRGMGVRSKRGWLWGNQSISSLYADGAWRGRRPGATKTASPRRVRPAAQGLRASHTRAARAIRRRLVALIEIAATSRSARALTSTKAIAPPLRAMRSISPPETTNRRARIRIALEAQQQRGDRFRLEAEEMRAAPALGPLERGPRRSPRGAGERERARIDLPSRQAVLGGDRRRRVLDREVGRATRRSPGRARRRRSARAPAAAPTTITISPRGASVAAYSAASASSAPRLTSSCSLVSSRATAAGRGPSSSARSASVSARRPGAS